jgi:hypothetical protein
MRGITTLAIAALLSLVAAPRARGDDSALSEHLGPREIALGDAKRADATGASAIALNPAGLALNRELVFELGYNRESSAGTDSIGVSACDSTVPVPGCFYYRYYQSKPELGLTELDLRAHEAGFTAARAFGSHIAVGTTTKWFDYETDLSGDRSSSGWGLDAGLVFLASQAIRLGVASYNLVAKDSPHYPRGLGVGLALRPLGSLGLFADGVWNLDLPEGEDTGRYGGGAEYFLVTEGGQTGYPFRAGVVRDTTVDRTYVTAGLGFRSLSIGIDLAVRKDVDGSEALLVGSIRVFAPGAGRDRPARL